MIKSESDPNLFYLKQDGGLPLLLVYVDELLITRSDSMEIAKLKADLQSQFEMTDLGEASEYLGVEIHKQEGGIFISQRGYVIKLLDKFGLRDCNPTKLPIDPKEILQKNMGTEKINPMIYRSLVGSLLYLSISRPDICYVVSCISKYMQEPEQAHYQAAKKILRYLSGTFDHGVFMPSDANTTFHTFVDAD